MHSDTQSDPASPPLISSPAELATPDDTSYEQLSNYFHLETELIDNVTLQIENALYDLRELEEKVCITLTVPSYVWRLFKKMRV